MEKEKKELAAAFYELKDRIKGRLNFVQSSGWPDDETKIRVNENEVFLKVIDKVVNSKIKPIETIETVRGSKYEIGDIFCINGNLNTKYKIVYFPDSVTVRGVSNNPEIGEAWTVEAYIENVFKPTKPKKEEPVKEEKRKKVDIEVGDYFAIKTNNTIYKATKVKKKQVFGSNELTSKYAVKNVGALRADIILKTKKDYKKQHKAERKFEVTAVKTKLNPELPLIQFSYPQKAKRIR